MSHARATFDMIRRIKQTAQIKVGRNFESFFADRIIQAFSEPTLLDAVERLARIVDADVSYIGGQKMAAFMAAAQSDEGRSILYWVRRRPRVTAMIAMMRDEDDFASALDSIYVGDAAPASADDTAVPAADYDVGLTVQLLSPLAHGSDSKAGNATLFRRRQVLTPGGNVLELPFYAGNALRGIMRDLLADDLLTRLGLSADRSKPAVSLWFFHAIYAGGVLAEGGGDKVQAALNKELGNHGSIRTDGIRRIREMLPSVSLLGAALGNRILCGRINVGDLRPQCKEWGNGALPAAELLTHEYLTRRDDFEGRTDEDAHAGMIATTEVLREGSTLVGGIDIDAHASEIERAALGHGLDLLVTRGTLGAESRRGFGKCIFTLANKPDAAPYLDFVQAQKSQILAYLDEVGALPKCTLLS